MDAIRYLDADTILDYLHNSSETYLEGLIPQSCNGYKGTFLAVNREATTVRKQSRS